MTLSHRSIFTAAIAALAVTGASSAFADSVTLSYQGASPSASVSVATQTGSFFGYPLYSHYSGLAGEMNFKVTGTSDTANGQTNPFTVNSTIATFCIDPAHSLSSTDTYTVDYAPFTDNNAGLLAELYAAHFDDIKTDTLHSAGIYAAAFQLALWEIVTDAPNSGSYTYNNGLTTGKFLNDGTSSTITSIATTWLSDFQTKGADTTGWSLYELDAGSSGQDQLFATHTTVSGGGNISTPSTPLPAAAPMGMLLLSGIAGVKKLRRKA